VGGCLGQVRDEHFGLKGEEGPGQGGKGSGHGQGNGQQPEHGEPQPQLEPQVVAAAPEEYADMSTFEEDNIVQHDEVGAVQGDEAPASGGCGGPRLCRPPTTLPVGLTLGVGPAGDAPADALSDGRGAGGQHRGHADLRHLHHLRQVLPDAARLAFRIR
jgi:hypothetical protein